MRIRIPTVTDVKSAMLSLRKEVRDDLRYTWLTSVRMYRVTRREFLRTRADKKEAQIKLLINEVIDISKRKTLPLDKAIGTYKALRKLRNVQYESMTAQLEEVGLTRYAERSKKLRSAVDSILSFRGEYFVYKNGKFYFRHGRNRYSVAKLPKNSNPGELGQILPRGSTEFPTYYEVESRLIDFVTVAVHKLTLWKNASPDR